MFAVTRPLAEADMVEPRWYLETYCELPGAGAHSRAKRIENRLNEWGKALFDALFGAMEGAYMHHDLAEREKEGDLRLVTLGAEDPRAPR